MEIPDCPEFLDAQAKAEWERTSQVLAGMGLLTLADRSALAAYCVAYSRWVQAEQQVARFGTIVKSPEKGFPMKSPYLTVADQALESMRQADGRVRPHAIQSQPHSCARGWPGRRRV